MKYYNIKLLSVVSLLALAAPDTHAAKWQKAERCADKKANKKYYAQAADMYERILAKKRMHLPADSVNSVKIRLANCYMKMENTIKAEANYADVVKSGKADATTTFNYARVLESNGKYSEAKDWFDKIADDRSVQNKLPKGFSEMCERAMKGAKSDKFAITRLGFNTPASEYAPAFYQKGLAYTSNAAERGKSSNRIMWNKEPYTDIYTVQEDNKGDLRTTDKLPSPINSRLNDGAIVFNSAGTEAFFTRNNKKCKKHDQLQIFRTTYDGQNWSRPELLTFEMPGASYAHPALSPDGMTLYFSSDMTGSGYGGMDIYMVRRNNNNAWETAVNLGATINSSGNETFPYMADDSSLYFTSDGWPGYGGMDIFHSKMEGGKFSKPENMGHDFNSSKDDLSAIVDSKNRIGYMASNRDGDDDIYSFRLASKKNAADDNKDKKAPETERSGKIVDKTTNTPISGARVEISKPNNPMGGTFYYTNENGVFFLNKKIDADDNVKVYKDRYKVAEMKGMNVSDSRAFEVSMDSDASATGPAKQYSTTLYYDVNKSSLTDKDLNALRPIVEIMKNSPKSLVYISGFADERGGDTYNLGLSLRRVKECVEFLSSEGVDQVRIRSAYFGAVKLSQDCMSKPKCVTDTNRENRRVEIYVSQ